jgi:hypothetical protein
MTIGNSRLTVWKEAVASGDTFKFAKVSGDRDLIGRMWKRLRDAGADPLSRDMLSVKDLEHGIIGLVEKGAKYDQLEDILNRTDLPDNRVIEMLSAAFYD